MRKTFITTLAKLVKEDKDIILMTGDVGFSYFEDFREMFPDNFINCGIIEQTMFGIAAGLALSGKKPYIYTMIPFAIMRPFEQLRNDICYQNLNVKIIGVLGSKHYGFLGFTHNIAPNEDKKILSVLPNLKQYYPRNKKEVEKNILDSYKIKKPVYIRL